MSTDINDTFYRILYAVSPIVFLLVFAFWTIITIILDYHWRSFGIAKGDTKKAKDWYYGASLILLFTMAASFIAILLR